ncbi:HIT domain-containing protein [Paenibacillus cremeus]|uniref:HIT domain-containing protein n=1 Tax=Paenibacillus cremeus TaxID=2163881 RepID=UPI0028F6D04C|nr:HIT domain-containing protein [Paenibacillus cremeus]
MGEHSCLGCRLANGTQPSHIVFEDEHVTCLMDIAPIHEGHVLILPKQHAVDVDELDAATAAAIMAAASKLSRALKTAFKPDGISVMQNGGLFNDLGHYHMHVFPRYEGDGFAWIEPEETPGAASRLAEVRDLLREANAELNPKVASAGSSASSSSKLPRTIACLHAHHSNIRYLDEAFAGTGMILKHFVDPGMIEHLRSGGQDALRRAGEKLLDQLAWMAGCEVDAIVITCTNYIAVLDTLPEDQRQLAIPVIPIDEPWFDALLALERKLVLAFTNPATVEGTMGRLRQYAAAKGVTLHAEAAVTEDSFQLLMQGEVEAYHQRVEQFLRELTEQAGAAVAISQLSMTEGAERIRRTSGLELIGPLGELYKRLMN